MKNLTIAKLAFIALVLFTSCKKQNTPTPINLQKPKVGTDAYYANLRAYKQSKHEVFFCWFGSSGSRGETANSMGYRWEGLPDSVDIVSLWGGCPKPGSNLDKAMRVVQHEKGTKMLWVEFAEEGMLKGYGLSEEGIAKKAKAVADSVKKYQLDGFDIDWEPQGNFGYFTPDKMELYLKELSKYMGPKSKTGLLLDVDGSGMAYLTQTGIDCLDYVIDQAYSIASAPSILQNSYLSIGGSGGSNVNCPAQKYICTEFISSNVQTGGINYNDPVHGIIPSMLGMAYWNPKEGNKGGCGAFTIDQEYDTTPDHKWTRQAIQIMNPAVY